jgi:hypothetical protein
VRSYTTTTHYIILFTCIHKYAMTMHSSGVLKYNKKQCDEDNRRIKLLNLKTSKFYTMESGHRSFSAGGWIMMFSATSNNSSAISWRSVLLVEFFSANWTIIYRKCKQNMKSTFNRLIYILKLILNVQIETNFLNPQLNLIALMLNFEMKWKLKKYQKVRTIPKCNWKIT